MFDAGIGSAAKWWLAGGVAAGDCVAAYQAKGAASYAASKVNLANPGTYNAADGTAYPTWNAATGWTFNGSQWLTISAQCKTSQDQSAIVGYSGLTAASAAALLGTGRVVANGLFVMQPRRAENKRGYLNGKDLVLATTYSTSGIMCISGTKAYHDAIEEGTIPASTLTAASFTIGGLDASSPWFSGVIVAVSIYSSTLTATQVAAITAAMQAL